jgi:hypothetical protein
MFCLDLTFLSHWWDNCTLPQTDSIRQKRKSLSVWVKSLAVKSFVAADGIMDWWYSEGEVPACYFASREKLRRKPIFTQVIHTRNISKCVAIDSLLLSYQTWTDLDVNSVGIYA